MTRQQEEKKAFLDAIAENPDDTTTRRIYADWLTENGFDDEAESYRNWNFVKAGAEKWLIDFAKQYSLFDGYYGALQAGHNQCFIGNSGDTAVQDFRIDYNLVQDFWIAWSTVTGSTIPHETDHDFDDGEYSVYPRYFTCGC